MLHLYYTKSSDRLLPSEKTEKLYLRGLAQPVKKGSCEYQRDGVRRHFLRCSHLMYVFLFNPIAENHLSTPSSERILENSP